jgi:hypothetical protein
VNSLHIAWGSLGQIFLVSFGTAVGVIVIFSLGVAVLAPSTAAPLPRCASPPACWSSATASL